MTARRLTLDSAAERRRARWATAVAVALDLLVPSVFAADATSHDLASRFAASTVLLTAAVGAVLWLSPPARAVGVGLVRGSAAVFLFFLVLLPLLLLGLSALGLV